MPKNTKYKPSPPKKSTPAPPTLNIPKNCLYVSAPPLSLMTICINEIGKNKKIHKLNYIQNTIDKNIHNIEIVIQKKKILN